MGQKVSAAACGSLMGMAYQPQANLAERSGLGGHHRLQQEWHHGSGALAESIMRLSIYRIISMIHL